MSRNHSNALTLNADRDRLRFDIRSLESDILRIKQQLEHAEDGYGIAGVDTDWYRKAQDAKRHKEREHRVLDAKFQRLTRRLDRMSPILKDSQAKSQLRETLQALFRVARASLALYEKDTEGNETALTDALDRLDELVPDWEQPQQLLPQPAMKPAFAKMGL